MSFNHVHGQAFLTISAKETHITFDLQTSCTGLEHIVSSIRTYTKMQNLVTDLIILNEISMVPKEH